MLEKHTQFQAVTLVIVKFSDIKEKIIPFFEKYQIKGTKYNDYLKFKEAALLIKNKEHLGVAEKGLNKIIDLKKSMNKKD